MFDLNGDGDVDAEEFEQVQVMKTDATGKPHVTRQSYRDSHNLSFLSDVWYNNHWCVLISLLSIGKGI